MASREEVTLPATRPKSRKSLAHIPTARMMDQENMTADIGALGGGKRATPGDKGSKKSRSKSIGPGGLDALKNSSGNRRKSLAAIPQPLPRSILKPTMPPLREIPAHISARKGGPKKSTPPSAQKPEDLIDFALSPGPGATITGADRLPNPFQMDGNPAVNETRVTLRTEEEQHSAARDRDEKERQELEKEIISRRDARRKSLANRRVSFAPEATLHTWDVVVEYQDSTTSSNATSSTRHASSVFGGSVESPYSQTPSLPDSDASETPSTPPEQAEGDKNVASLDHQHDLHQAKRRRSSGIPPMNFNSLDDEAFSSSPFSGSSAGDAFEVGGEEADSNSNSDSDDNETAMSIDGGETTDMSMASIKSGSSTGSSSRLDQALREAARQAGTQGIEFDEDGDQELTEEEVVASFAPWAKSASVQNLESQQDQENINPFSAAVKENTLQPSTEPADDDITMEMTRPMGGIVSGKEPDDDEMSMDVTRALGAIISNKSSNSPGTRRKPITPSRRQSIRRKSTSKESSMADGTMELTAAVGGIYQAPDTTASDNDEDITMEFTSVVGGMLPQGNPSARTRKLSILATQKNRDTRPRESIDSSLGDDTMDITTAVGGIIPSIYSPSQDEQDATTGMEITTALGSILQPGPDPRSRAEAKRVMEVETDLGSSPFQLEVATSPLKESAPVRTVASETGSPSLAAFRGNGLRRSTEARRSTSPRKSKLDSCSTPVKNPTTPSKRLTPQPVRPITPGKTPPSRSVAVRSTSPKRLLKTELRAASSNSQSAKVKQAVTPSQLFQKNQNTGVSTPTVVLAPQRRRSSGIGLDREGLGSPRVAALLDRRGSIGKQAKSFVASHLSEVTRGVRFDAPRAIEEEVNNECNQEEDCENGRSIMDREADHPDDEKDATLNLKEMIQSLTPKKRPLKGRKSLHVGAAKGVLGKRPAELDDDEDDDDDGGVKRLKGHQGSPVKNVRLQGPPSKAETTGRLARVARKSLGETADSVVAPPISSTDISKATTPRSQGYFKDAEANLTGQMVPLTERKAVGDPQINEGSVENGRIQLQDFLNMTNIRFMELTTTKRRHTIAAKLSTDDPKDPKEDTEVSLEDCVAAGAATIPMLELFQHACHELKSYISEGRKTVREIETETFEENPPLFREYISAMPDMKIVMDNQLKNVKTHARLLSKEMWYDWRMTLLSTLTGGLEKTREGMIHDEEILDHQQILLDSVLPQLLQKAEVLEHEVTDLQSAAEDLANCDPEELSSVRQDLIAVDADIETKRRLITDLRKQLDAEEVELGTSAERKQVCMEEIRKAEKIREECRGWTSSEINSFKAKVDAIEQEHGWTITGVSGTTTSMTYRKDIELVFDAASFLPSEADSSARHPVNARLDLWYIGASRELNPEPLTVEREFFLQAIRGYIRGLSQAQTHVKDLLKAVSISWNKAATVVDDILLLNVSCPTHISKVSDNSVMIKSSLLIVPLTTKVELAVQLTSQSREEGIVVEMAPSATIVYGERFNEPKMGEFLLNRCGNVVEEKGRSTKVSWGNAIAELGEKLLARGRK
ncbi:Uncharacterized protein BP5553_09984 [Venustampulla echinocandica]|uniref:Spc7 kinetochore protein domain-containing protein n=1 Tax=Venustampulla echinocandica TaxID=2656787 RepID=A0A370TB98_9HELO|nr:Uncharacterized protein BP5553_09984 [Venustampulla echinocandica]RDL31195.1 Uncharacterized protein BP5553_09984 [Venustampulla echinocandica]